MGPNWSISFVRTVVAPSLVGFLGQYIVFAGNAVDPVRRGVVAALIAVLWYFVARLAQAWKPNLGFLLIVSARPYYAEDGIGNTLGVSIVRTVVPLAVATALACLVVVLVGGSTPVFALSIAAYYGSLRWIEDHSTLDSTARTITGLMLGARAAPYY